MPGYILFPLLFILTIVPLIVYLKVVPLSGGAFLGWNGQKENMDFFSYYKAVWFVLATSLAVGMMLYYRFMHSECCPGRNYWIYGPAGLYALLVILSTAFALHSNIALWGFPDRYEGVFVLLSYVAIFVVASYGVDNPRQLKITLGSLLVGATLIGCLGLGQYLGWDLWKTAFGKYLILPAQYLPDADKVQFQFSKHIIYASLYHPDFVGSYMAMLFPLVTALFMFARRWLLKIPLGLLAVLMGINWLGSTSRAGLFGGIVAMLVLMVMMYQYLGQHWKWIVTGILVIALVGWGLNHLSGGYLSKRGISLAYDAGVMMGVYPDNTPAPQVPLKDLQVVGNTATISTTDGTLKFTLKGTQVEFADGSDQPLAAHYDQTKGLITFVDSRYKNFQLQTGKLGQQNALILVDGSIKLYFGVEGNKLQALDFKGQPLPLQSPPSWGFAGKKQLLGSSRGYIWSRSIPLLKDTVLLGHGPDTFALYFPQYDLKGKMYAYGGDMWQIVDKPHDLYLQVGINTGILSLLAMLALFLMYLGSSVRLYFGHHLDTFSAQAGVGILAAIVGYLGAAFFNDSLVSVAPVFWILLGLGVAANRLTRAERVS